MIIPDWITTFGWITFERVTEAVSRLFGGYRHHAEAKERRVDHLIRFTEQHHKIMSGLLSNPDTARIFDEAADASAITKQELHGVNFVLLHLNSALRAAKAKLYRMPERIDSDTREFLSLPIPKAAWPMLKPSHDSELVKFIERVLAD